MSPDAPTLAFLLDSPLQSWGHSSRFNRRLAGSHPTKSGIVALLACARGIDKHADEEENRLAGLAALTLTTIRLPRGRDESHNPLEAAELGSPPAHGIPSLTDYHTVGVSYREDDPWENMMMIRMAELNASGHQRIRKLGGRYAPVVTKRDYLIDTRFAVLLQGDPDELERCRGDLHDPVWGLWLGRKSCLPSVPILGLIHNDPAAAWAWVSAMAGFPNESPIDRFERYEETTPDLADFTLLDQPVSFRRREFHARPVRRHLPD